MACDMCGKDGSLFTTRIEGAIMKVCASCKSYGEVLDAPNSHKPTFKRRSKRPVFREEESTDRIVTDFAEIIRHARQGKHVEMEKFAKELNEKESLLKHIEAGKTKPSFRVAKKLEKALNIKLIESEIGGIEVPQSQNTGGMTIGDMIKIRKK